jgi:Tfx family DNA-binding protein
MLIFFVALGNTGYLTPLQLHILSLRARGFTQEEIAKKLGLTRSTVSVIEARAKGKVEKAKRTIDAYETVCATRHNVVIPKNTRLAQVPFLVFKVADGLGIHLKVNIMDIIRMVKIKSPNCVDHGRITRRLAFTINERGEVYLSR